jgi:hypothetical protein
MADFSIKAHDRLPSISAQFKTNGAAVNLSTATSVNFIMRVKGGTTVAINAPATVVNASAGTVRYDWAAGDTNAPGDYEAEWQVTWATGIKQTFPTLTYHTVAVLADLDNA